MTRGLRNASKMVSLLCAILFCSAPLFAKRQIYSGKINHNAPAVTGLHKSGKELPGPTTPVPDLAEGMNQCAGTVQHYRLPPSGYTPPAKSDASRQGKLLYQKHNCASCHEAEGAGGTLGPPLDGIGGARGEQFITAHLLDPEKQMLEFPVLFGGRSNIMPHLGIDLDQAKLITAYLLTLPDPENGFLVTTHAKAAPKKETKTTKAETTATSGGAESIKKGRALFLSRGCAACHTIDGAATRFGPRLDGIASRMSRSEMEAVLRGGNDEPEMIRTLHLSPQEMSAMVDFLKSLPESKKPTPRQ